MLSKRASFFEHPNLNFTQRSAGFVVGLDEFGKLYRAGESGRTASDEQNVHWNGFGTGWLAQYQPIQRQRRLVPAWENAERAIRH
jgi:hypothetical protein